MFFPFLSFRLSFSYPLLLLPSKVFLPLQPLSCSFSALLSLSLSLSISTKNGQLSVSFHCLLCSLSISAPHAAIADYHGDLGGGYGAAEGSLGEAQFRYKCAARGTHEIHTAVPASFPPAPVRPAPPPALLHQIPAQKRSPSLSTPFDAQQSEKISGGPEGAEFRPWRDSESSLAGYFPSLETINIQSCRGMVNVVPTSQREIDSSYPSLESIHLSNCQRLQSFSGMGLPSKLKKLGIKDCPILVANRTTWDLQRLSSLQSLDISKCKFEGAEGSFPEEGLLPSTLTSLRIMYVNLKALNGKGLQHLTSSHLPSTFINYVLQRIGVLARRRAALTLTYLSITECPLLNERRQRGTGEDWCKIQHISKIEINKREI